MQVGVGSRIYELWGTVRMVKTKMEVWGSQAHGSLKYRVGELGLYPLGCGGRGALQAGGEG